MTTLTVMRRRDNAPREFAFLDYLPFHVGICARQDAERFGEWFKDEAILFLRKRGKPFPAPEHILNPRPQRREVRNG